MRVIIPLGLLRAFRAHAGFSGSTAIAEFSPPSVGVPVWSETASPVSVEHRQMWIVGLRFRFLAIGSPTDCTPFLITD